MWWRGEWGKASSCDGEMAVGGGKGWVFGVEKKLTASAAVPVFEEDDIGGTLSVGALVDGTPPVHDELGVSAPQLPLRHRSQHDGYRCRR